MRRPFGTRTQRLLSGARGHFQCGTPRAAAGGSDFWPDGTPKRFKGKEAWKNWINWDAPFREQSDDLNRLRHFFWEVDDKGRLWKLELDCLGERFGQMRHTKVLDELLGHMQHNNSGFYTEAFPFVSKRTHEHYFVRWSTSGLEARSRLEVPIVFNDLRNGEFRVAVPGTGELLPSLTTRFEPSALRLTRNGRLLHPVWTKGRLPVQAGQVQAPRVRQRFFAAMDAPTAHTLFEQCEDADCPEVEGASGVQLRWDDTTVPLKFLEDLQT